jgi:glutaredoxin-related protein
VEYAEVNLAHTIRTPVLYAIAKARTVPQLFVNGELIGGSEEIEGWVKVVRFDSEGRRPNQRRTTGTRC